MSTAVNYSIGAVERHWHQRFPGAQHVPCVAHVLNLDGAMFRDHPCLPVLHVQSPIEF